MDTKTFPISAKTAKASQLVKLRDIFPKHVPPFTICSMAWSNERIWKETQKFFPQKTQLIFRTSAKGEDEAFGSAAGLFESVPAVTSSNLNQVSKAIDRCRESLATERVVSYLGHPVPLKQAELIIQQYIKTPLAGVAFVYHEDNDDSTISLGKPGAVTSGDQATHTVSLQVFLDIDIGLPHQVKKSLIASFQQLGELSSIPIDVEWLASDTTFYLVQFRPISTTSASPFGEVAFDATNIGENYPGTTAPLTYSFVRGAYASVYPHFLQILGTKPEILAKYAYATSNLVAYVDGRLYYNLENWYRLLKLLPFYSQLKVFFNRMLVPVKSIDSIDHELSQVSIKTSLLFTWYMLFPVFRTRAFERAFPVLYSNYDTGGWRKKTTTELLRSFESLRDTFFALWANTIINDFHVMVFWGLLVGLSQKTYRNHKHYLNTVVDVARFPDSLKPLHALQAISLQIKQNADAQSLFSKSPSIILQKIKTDLCFQDIYTSFLEYLELYGDRSGQELKIEVPKFSERPEEVIRLLQEYVKTDAVSPHTQRKVSPQLLVKHWWLVPVITIIKQIAVAGIYRRERYRLMRSKAFGIARSVFLDLGNRLVNQRLLKNVDDVFYLTYEELSSLVGYTTLPFEPAKLIENRRRLLQKLRTRTHPTRALAYTWNTPKGQLVADDQPANQALSGTGTSITPPVSGQAYVMDEFDVNASLSGKILVTKKTDPGWTVLFPLVKGVVTETGSTLSHASIITRELGIPCITAVTNCTVLIKSGDWLTLIPETGQVRLDKS